MHSKFSGSLAFIVYNWVLSMRLLLFLVHVPCLPQLPPKSGKYWTFQQSVVPCLTEITEGMTHSIFLLAKERIILDIVDLVFIIILKSKHDSSFLNLPLCLFYYLYSYICLWILYDTLHIQELKNKCFPNY